MFDIEYNGKRARTYKSYIRERPSIPAARKKVEEYECPGREGKLYITDGTLEDIQIEIQICFFTSPEEWGKTYRALRKWLIEDGDGELIFSDDKEYFYKVKLAEIAGTERTAKKIGELTAAFTCEGYQYVREGKEYKEIEEILYNPYSLCKPEYEIKGEGLCKINCNGKEIQVNVAQNVVINTEKMIAYRMDGEMINASMKGDYEDLYLSEGKNEISISEGFEVRIKPNWRCI